MSQVWYKTQNFLRFLKELSKNWRAFTNGVVEETIIIITKLAVLKIYNSGQMPREGRPGRLRVHTESEWNRL